MVEHARFAALFHAEYARLCRVAVRFVHDRNVAEQVVSESFLTLWRRREDVDWERAAPFLYRIVVNECKDASVARGREQDLTSRIAVLDLVPHQRGVVPDVAPRVAGDAAVLEQLRQLPHQQRAVVILRVYEDLPEAEVAEVLGISVGSVKSHYSRGLAALRAAMVGATT